MTPAKGAWEASQSGMASKREALQTRHSELLKRFSGITGLTGADLGTQDAINALLKGEAVAVESLNAKITTSRTAVEAALKGGKLAPAQQAIDASKKDFDVAAAEAEAQLAANEKKVGDLQTAAAKAAQLAALAKAAADAQAATDKAFTDRLEKAQKEGGEVEFPGIEFKADSATLDLEKPGTVATLAKLQGFVGACDELVVNLTGHTSHEVSAGTAKKMSLERAQAVRDYLVKQGVPLKKFAKVDGVGFTVDAIKEFKPDEPEYGKVDPTEMESIRTKNRRVTVTIAKHCK
jgi:outer membrane protein OmpA-like peptidoglycan-associated protein